MDVFEVKLKVADLLRDFRSASDEELNAVYQWAASITNSSAWAHTHEPMNGIVVAIQAEFAKRRLADEEEECGQ